MLSRIKTFPCQSLYGILREFQIGKTASKATQNFSFIHQQRNVDQIRLLSTSWWRSAEKENLQRDKSHCDGTLNAANMKDGNLPDDDIEQQLRIELSKATSENATNMAKARDFEDKYLRALAETENVRTRLTKQISDAKLFAIQGFCKDLTDIEDILRLAVDSVPKDQITDENKHLKNLYEGLKMTDARLLQIFQRHGLTLIDPINTKFNPNEHEAVVVQEIEGKESGTVVFVSKIGYKLHERVIRPAVVGVAK